MLCCMETPWSNPQDSYQHQTGDFPGNRRFQKTAGNALHAVPPNQQYNHQQQQNLTDNNEGGGELVCGEY